MWFAPLVGLVIKKLAVPLPVLIAVGAVATCSFIQALRLRQDTEAARSDED